MVAERKYTPKTRVASRLSQEMSPPRQDDGWLLNHGEKNQTKWWGKKTKDKIHDKKTKIVYG